jgi:hypothetical protein
MKALRPESGIGYYVPEDHLPQTGGAAMEYIAFDSHKRYTMASVEKLSGRQSCELRLAHQPGSIRQFLSRWTPGSPVALETIGNWATWGTLRRYATARRRRERRGSQFTAQQWQQVIALLQEEWSPEQISNHLKQHADFAMSHETIYKYVLWDKKRGGTLYKHLRIMPKARRKRITFDNGTEFHDYKTLEQHFPLNCYFATPYHAWERGSNENLNGLIRQYLPKRMCMRDLTQAHCDYIAHKLNSRPRKRHGYRTPCSVYNENSRSLHFRVEPKKPDFIVAIQLEVVLCG